MAETHHISYFIAFAAGLLSFVSPCVFPLIPSYLSYITGISFDDLARQGEQKGLVKSCFFNSIAFMAGFSLIFVALGASTSLLGSFLRQYLELLRVVGGGLIIFFGLFILGVFKFNFILRERRFNLKRKPAGYTGSVLVGIVFGIGWTPCIGPILGSILSLAATSGSVFFGVQLLLVYSLGLGLPFLLTSLALNRFLRTMPRVTRHMKLITSISGGILILVGLLLVTGHFTDLARWFQAAGLGWDLNPGVGVE